MKVCIVGGGIGGLCGAYHLSKKGVDVSVFEKKNALGGNCTSYAIEGYTVDTGLHYPFYFDEEDVLFEILVDKKNLFVNSSPPVLNERYREYSLFSHRFTPFQILKLCYYFTRKKLGKYSVEDSLQDMLKKTKLYEHNIIDWAYAWSYSSWGLDLRNVPAEMFFKSLFFKNTTPTKAFINKIQRIYAPKKFIEGYPKGGIKTVTDTLIEKTRKAGAKLYINSEVTEIKKTKTDFRVSIKGKEYDFDKIVYTAPIQTLPHLIDLPSDFENKIGRATPWRGITIWLGINKLYFKKARLHFADSFFPVILPTSLFDTSLAPKNHQLIGVATGLTKRKVEKDYAINKILDAVEYNYPNLLNFEVFRHVQFLNLSSTKQGISDEKFQYKTPIKGLFLAGTNVFEEKVGVNWTAYTGKKVADIVAHSE